MLAAFTLFHVILSLIGIFAGLYVVYGMLAAKSVGGWTKIFLVTTIATSATGYLFPFHKLLPSHIVGFISLVVLAIAWVALGKGWKRTYAITAVLALYFNMFVLVVQSFLKVPSLQVLAPTQSEPPFQIAQGILLVIFVLIGIMAAKKYPKSSVI